MSSKELKLAAKVEKKRKRRKEKDVKRKKLKIAAKNDKEARKEEKKRKKKKLEKIQRKEQRRREKKLEEEKKLKKNLKRQMKHEKKLKREKKKIKGAEEKRLRKELKKSLKSRKKQPKDSKGDKILVPFSKTSKSDQKSEKDFKKRSEQKDDDNKKTKLENVSRPPPAGSIPEKMPVTLKTVESSISEFVNVKSGAILTPTPTPIPQKTTENSATAVTVRKPITIRKPGAKREINPIYTMPAVTVKNSSNGNNGSIISDFIVPGVNDSEESRILTRTFADRWILPANLYKIEARTGLKYRRGRFSEAEKLLAMKLTTKFCQEQNMSLERFKTIFFDDMGTENGHQNRLSNFFVDVSQHFGGRPVVAVYDFLKRLYHPGNHRGPWTPEEDEILLREYKKHGPKWTLIGKELNRLGLNCRDRYNIRWKHEGKISSGAWALEEDQKLREAVKNSIETSGTISWLWISEERVKTRTPLQCLVRWKLLKSKGDAFSISSSSNNNNISDNRKVSIKKSTEQVPKKTTLSWSGWKEDEDYLLIHSILISGAISDETIPWKSLIVTGIPSSRHSPELFFRRWNHLKTKAGVTNEEEENDLKGSIEKVKKYLITLSKSPAYIFSEDEED